MAATITSESKSEYLLITGNGELRSAEDLIEQAEAIYSEFTKHDHTKILIDQRETTFPTRFFSYLDLVDHYVTMPIMLIKIAVVIDPKNKEIGDFWETACNNRGYQYFAFTSYEEAERWIIE